MKEDKLDLTIVKRQGDDSSSSTPLVEVLPPAPVKNGVAPFCKFVNVVLCGGLQSHEGLKGYQATVLLENPKGESIPTVQRLVEQVC